MTVLNEDMARTGGYIVSSPNHTRGVERVVIASGSGRVKAGTVLGKVTATGKYAPLNTAATDGSQTAAAILFEMCDATEAEMRRTVTIRDTEVAGGKLIWPENMTDEQKRSALADMAVIGIIVR
ncbi:head decoration protein [Paracoccus sp. (in: a-proteobacteria)]|uniref:head decoration protein n=1 Tax=Paracoccus sp. TaxID=267 RepID=UPI003A844CB0